MLMAELRRTLNAHISQHFPNGCFIVIHVYYISWVIIPGRSWTRAPLKMSLSTISLTKSSCRSSAPRYTRSLLFNFPLE